MVETARASGLARRMDVCPGSPAVLPFRGRVGRFHGTLEPYRGIIGPFRGREGSDRGMSRPFRGRVGRFPRSLSHTAEPCVRSAVWTG
jgi:hypothetical protein